MDLLLGTYEHTLDDKTRLIIPAKVRLKMGGLVYLSKGFDGCLELRSIEAFEKWTDKVADFKTTNDKARFFSRDFFSNTIEAEVDTAGRIKIPAHLMKAAHLEKEVVIIGTGDKLEIWSKDRYDNYLHNVEIKIAEDPHLLGGE